MKLLFWNLKENKNEEYINQLLDEKAIDIAIFSEYAKTDFTKISKEYKCIEGMGGCDKVRMILRSNIAGHVRREQSRYAIYTVKFDDVDYIIVGLHLQANNYSNSRVRMITIRDLMNDLDSFKKESKIATTIIIGDFNAGPFDDDLVGKDGFNAVLFKDIIEKNKQVKFQNKYYRFLYNPIIEYLSETKKQYGSFYYSNGINSIYWYCYDQVLLSRNLRDSIKDLEYCKIINGKSLLKNVALNSEISDHLPLFVELKGVLLDA